MCPKSDAVHHTPPGFNFRPPFSVEQRRAVCGQVPKIWDAGDEAAIAFAIDHCPVPNSVHAFPLRAGHQQGCQPGKMKTDRAAAAIEATATMANRAMPGELLKHRTVPPETSTSRTDLTFTVTAGGLRGG
jgi:hypothetical protein